MLVVVVALQLRLRVEVGTTLPAFVIVVLHGIPPVSGAEVDRYGAAVHGENRAEVVPTRNEATSSPSETVLRSQRDGVVALISLE